ncbi:MAG TPA: PQQ-dependent sugar dehydrogenase [Vicinamibacterales bacterium]|nr:PQQ-dependent sugar dehydrogenase [Vicinamibacterales bacterium]
MLVLTLFSPALALAQLRAELVASGLSSPLDVVFDPVVPGVAYIVEQAGLVRAVRDGQVLAMPFADLRSIVLSGGERGLLGMAFPPDAGTTGRVFFNSTNSNGDTVVARFRRSSANPLVVDSATRFDLRWPTGERIIRQPFANHNGGNLIFGPDGYLYIGLGDGGSANDPQNNAQNPRSLLGKMLRIDVSVPDGDATGYRVPPDNPFASGSPVAAFPEIWDFGVRNPWRYSFDDLGAGATGALVIADVGQNAREEVNYEPRGAGGRNYGWRIREGRIATPGVGATAPAFAPLVDPTYDYAHDVGASITGGFIYRGARLGAAYQGRYFFADYISARVWSLGLSVNPSTGEAAAVNVIEHTGELGGSGALGGIASFGRDLQGELYLATFAGRVFRIAPAAGAPAAPRNLQVVASGQTVVVSWNAPREGPVPAQYQLEAGSVPGATDRGVAFISGAVDVVSFAGVPAGTYYVRLRSIASGVASAATPDVTVRVGIAGCTGAPPPPQGLTTGVTARVVQLAWDLPTASDGPMAFVIEAGSAASLANLAVLPVDGALRSLQVTAPAGTYFVRVRAQNPCGTSTPSNEVVVTVF